MKQPAAVLSIVLALLAPAAPNTAAALTLGEAYTLDPTNRAWSIGGLYDANIIDYRGDGKRSDCIWAGPEGFAKRLLDFVGALPVDKSTKERRVWDAMNVAVVAALVMDKACLERP